jgi:SHS2 domain-containing protein
MMAMFFMKNYRLLPHTADIRIQAEGDTYIELFTVSLEGLCYVLNTQFDIKKPPTVREKVEITSIDVNALLIDFLNEALTLMFKNKALLPYVKFLELSGSTCKAELSGISINHFNEDVKAVTYNYAEIRKNFDNSYEIVITLDI